MLLKSERQIEDVQTVSGGTYPDSTRIASTGVSFNAQIDTITQTHIDNDQVFLANIPLRCARQFEGLRAVPGENKPVS